MKRVRAEKDQTYGTKQRFLAQNEFIMPQPPAAPLFSVITPCYNQARFLPEAVASVAAQDFTDLEVVIINDGSPDDASKIARSLAESYPELNIRLIEQTNLGTAAARNTGIAAARGHWIVALDSDDILAEGFLAEVAEAAERDPQASAFTGAYKEFGARESEWRLTRFDPERLKERGNILCCAPFRRTLWEAVGGYDSSHPWGGEDWHFWLKSLSAGLRLVCLPVPMLHYRIHAGGGTLSGMEQHAEDTLAMLRCMIPSLYSGPELLQAHNRLMCMDQATEQALRRKIAVHPGLPLPHFWLGLAHEGRGEAEAALRLYAAALRCPWPDAWQARQRVEAMDAKKRTEK